MGERALSILRILLIQQFPITINELAERFDVSTRTIRNDINQIDKILLQNRFPAIQTRHGKGIELILSETQRKDLENLIAESSIDYYSNSELRIFNLILEFTFGDKNYIYEKQNEFQLSKSSIDNDMKIVRNILNDYHLSLSTNRTKCIRVNGSEKNIRIMIFNIINQFIGAIDVNDERDLYSPYHHVLFSFIRLDHFRVVDQLYERFIKYDDAMYKNQSVLFIVLWIKRLTLGNVLTESDQKENSVKTDIDLLIKELEIHYELCIVDAEKNYTNFILKTLGYKSDKEASEWTYGQIVTLELIEHVQRELDIKFANQEKLFSGLFKHVISLISRLQNNLQIRNPLTDEIKNTNQELYEAIKSYTFKSNMDNNLPVHVTDDEITFIAIYFLLSMNKSYKKQPDYFYKAVVFCNHGNATARLLAQMLEEDFNIDVVAIKSSNEVPSIEELDVDIAFSTVDIKFEDVPLLVIDSLLSTENHKKIEMFLSFHKSTRKPVGTIDQKNKMFEDILSLIKKSGGEVKESTYKDLKNIFKENKISIDKELALPNLKQVLDDSNINYNLEVKDWRDAIRKTASPLLEEKVIESSYMTAMIDSVDLYGAYIVVGPYIALAHARPEDGVNEIGLSVSFLQEEVYFGEGSDNPVKLVFCLAPTDSHGHINIMKDIFNLTNNKESIEKLTSSQTKKEFKEILYQLTEGEEV